MAESQTTNRNIALLIDGDNAQYSYMELMLEEANRYGNLTILRAYGDWTRPNLANWRAVMQAYAIQPIQQWRYTTGKNATDSALIIDAMDILHSGTVQGFCIVSSDSDYTRLCTRIREDGLFVMGIGRKNTPEAFTNACDIFVYVENLAAPQDADEDFDVPIEHWFELDDDFETTDSSDVSQSEPPDLVTLLHQALEVAEAKEGWVSLSQLGHALHDLIPNFDTRTYGYKSLSLLVKSKQEYLDVKRSHKKIYYVRLKD